MDHLSKEQRGWLENTAVFPEFVELTSQSGTTLKCKILERDKDGYIAAVRNRFGHKGFVLKVQHLDTDAIYAAKFCVASDYETRRENDEARLATKLRQAGEIFVPPLFTGRVERFGAMPGVDEKFVWFLSDWVEGRTLAQYLSQSDGVTPEFVCQVAETVLRAIRYLKSYELKHDDLHAGNVMISIVDPMLALHDGEEGRLKIQIIDMGSLKPLSQATTKSKDDYLCLLQIFVDMYNAIWKNRKVASTYPYFLSKLGNLIDALSEEDPLRYLLDEAKVARQVLYLKNNLQPRTQRDLSQTFHPFEAISAEHLADDSTLLDLFVENLPWMSSLQEKKPIVFTGPRGCGKSMIFRYMAARTHINAKADHKQRLGQSVPDSFGVYISCASHLQNNLSWIARKEGRVKQYAAEIATFFQLIVLRELLRALGATFNDLNPSRRYEITESGLDELLNAVNEYFPTSIETPRLTSHQRIFQYADDVDRVRVKLNMDLLNDRKSPIVLPDTFLGDITDKLTAVIPHFSKCPVVFLLDDYSSNRVQPAIQEILNRIVFERRGSHYFKVSCEKFGFSADDIDGTAIDETREYVIVDAGQNAFDMTDVACRMFISRLIDQRLQTAQWKGRAETLIGSSKPHDNDVQLAKYIREYGSTQGQRFYYFGLDHLSRLWSGDTATTLQIVKEMFILASVDQLTEQKISEKDQHKAITAVSKAFKERVNVYHPYGPLMASILNEYSSAARDILINGSLNGKEPRRLYRVEMTKSEPLDTIALIEKSSIASGSNAAALAKELLRRAIFVELRDSRGKEGPAAITMRWEIRKIFLPAFGLSLVRKYYCDIKSMESLLTFLTDPKKFSETMRQSYMNSKKNDRDTADLFGSDATHE